MTAKRKVSPINAVWSVTLVMASSAEAPLAFAADPTVVTRSAPILTIDGKTFKDLNRNGKLDRYEDWRLSPKARAKDLVSKMTVAEKAGLMMHAAHTGFQGPGGEVMRELAPPPPGAIRSPVNVAGVPGFDRADKPSSYDLIENKHVRWISTAPGGAPADTARWANNLQAIAESTRLGIPVVLAADPVQTTNRMPGGALPPPDRRKLTSSWPDQIGLAAIGDVDQVYEFGKIAGAEYHALGFRMVINPMVDLSTEPRWNRIPGTFGEDAERAAAYTTAYIKGFQGEKLDSTSVLTVAKHFPGDGPVAEGYDPHQAYGKYQVYPAGMLDYHLIPFKAAIDADVGLIMGGYAIPKGIDTVAMNYSKPIITGLLRRKMGYKGIVITDWIHAQPWGVEHLTKEQRERKAIEAGVDQFGGEHETSYIISLVAKKEVKERRLDQSMMRILPPMFALGLFENPYVDPMVAEKTVNSPEFRAAGDLAQRKAIVLLKNDHQALPLSQSGKLFLLGFKAPPQTLEPRVVVSASQADLIVVKVNAPYMVRAGTEAFFKETHEGALVYAGAENAVELKLIEAAVATGKPVVVVMSMERPAVLNEFLDKVSAVIATFGSDDAAVADVLSGAFKPTGKLPFDLPADQEAVAMQKEDAPFDFARVQFKYGFGLTYPEN